MPLISARKVKARKLHRCGGEDCHYMGGTGWIEVGVTYYRLFGNAHTGDPPYVLRICPTCCYSSPELTKALKRSHG